MVFEVLCSFGFNNSGRVVEKGKTPHLFWWVLQIL